MKKIILLWSFTLFLYILQFVLMIINGATLINSICAWGSCIFLVLLLAINSIKEIYDSEKEYKEQLKKIEEKFNKLKVDIVDYNINCNNENNSEKNDKSEL